MDTDGNLGSRKFILTIISLVLLVGSAVMAAFVSTFVSIFPTLVGGIIGIVSVYITGNIVSKGVVLNSNGFALTQKGLPTNSTEVVVRKDVTGTTVQKSNDEEGKEA